MAEQGTKPYIKLASTLVLLGMGLFTLERYGLSQLEGPSRSFHLSEPFWSLLVMTPLALIVGGVVVFMVGRIRRL